ncbi:hypothetical protein EDD21DRAFT_369940 [Dissophora ornata]|nr:hypothetical protein EDD21DRAFT_369940 [Dissophora ornata]
MCWSLCSQSHPRNKRYNLSPISVFCITSSMVFSSVPIYIAVRKKGSSVQVSLPLLCKLRGSEALLHVLLLLGFFCFLSPGERLCCLYCLYCLTRMGACLGTLPFCNSLA